MPRATFRLLASTAMAALLAIPLAAPFATAQDREDQSGQDRGMGHGRMMGDHDMMGRQGMMGGDHMIGGDHMMGRQGMMQHGQTSRGGMQQTEDGLQLRDGGRQAEGPYRTGTARVASKQAVSARLVSADQLIEQPVVSQDGESIGSIDYIVVNPETGNVTAFLVKAGGLDTRMPELQPGGRQGFDPQDERRGQRQQGRQQQGQQQESEDLLVLPWHAVDLTLGAPGEVIVPMSYDALSDVPRITEATIQDITSPTLITKVVEYYVSDVQTGDRNGQDGGQAMRNNRQQQDGQQQDGQQRNRRRQGQTQGGQTQAGQGQDQGMPQMLVGRGIVGMIAPPAVTTVDRMRGLTVETDDGTSIGTVDMVMIDADTGSIDYVLVERDRQTARMGGSFVPLSFADLDLADDAQSFVLQPDAVLVGVVVTTEGATAGNRGSAGRQAGGGGHTGGGYGTEAYGGGR